MFRAARAEPRNDSEAFEVHCAIVASANGSHAGSRLFQELLHTVVTVAAGHHLIDDASALIRLRHG
jgi:hypothetical protein